MDKHGVLELWHKINQFIPVNWDDKSSVNDFKKAVDYYAKSWSKLKSEEQGWVCEMISNQYGPVA